MTAKDTDNKHKYTQAERKKVYKLKPVKVKNTPEIPHKKTKAAARIRKNIISTHIQSIYGTVYCPELDADVAFNKTVSNVETRYRASGSRKSTLLAVNIEALIPHAVKLYEGPAKANGQQKEFCRMHVLIAAVRGVGYAKITIGEYADSSLSKAPYCHYCVTGISLRQLKNKK